MSGIVIRAPRAGEGAQIAHLWRLLWDVHEAWGSYPGSKEPHAYRDVAERIDRDTSARADSPILGQHVHLIAEHQGRIVGQVEGWLERYGYRAETPYTCEVRSLVVATDARAIGVGRTLLAELGRVARIATRGPTVLVAEVLESNPAQKFYVNAGYTCIANHVRAPISTSAAGVPAASTPNALRFRPAGPNDAWQLAIADVHLATRRIQCGELRYDKPKPLDATTVGFISAHLSANYKDPADYVLATAAGNVLATASLAFHNLESPFMPGRRAVLGRIVHTQTTSSAAVLAAFLAPMRQLIAARGARTVELCDLGKVGNPLHNAALEVGAVPWSRIMSKLYG
jgi:GNAT superfamily N-acetyltransferase